jgi:hypothetical protein
MACKVLDQDQVPQPPTRVLNGTVDKDLDRWRFRDGLLVTYVHYLEEAKQRRGELPWAQWWGVDGA